MEKGKEELRELKNYGFEILTETDDYVTFKRVIPLKNRSKNEVHKIEMNLPKVTISYFDKEDFDNLRKISQEIYNSYYENDKKNSITKLVEKLSDFIVK